MPFEDWLVILIYFIFIDEIVCQLVRGGYGKIYLAFKKKTGNFFILKKSDGGDRYSVAEEIKFMNDYEELLSTTYEIVRVFDKFRYDHDDYIVLEYCEYGSLSRFIDYYKDNDQRIPEEVNIFFLKLICLKDCYKICISDGTGSRSIAYESYCS
jgi:serine/threonine protein kinase